ncbi:MAG TPA: class II glutamine amidotransferase [Gemmatimonadales bacterium]|jgi:predicted glutamine amidotransferase
MCRFTLYLGPPIRLAALLTEPSHSLIRQSVHSDERDEPLNGDGFGVGWYQPDIADEPAVFRSITPAWNNRNLHNIARLISSSCILAHVRAASDTSGVNEANCHPFRYGRYLLMHNGDIGNFRRVRRRLLESVCDEAFGNVFGSTDTEHFFAVVIDELLKRTTTDGGSEQLAEVLDRSIRRVVALVAEHGGGAASSLNVALSDGDAVVASRFTSETDREPETLYVFRGPLYAPAHASPRGRRRHEHGEAVVVASERLTTEAGWRAIPRNTMLRVDRGAEPAFVACGYAAGGR